MLDRYSKPVKKELMRLNGVVYERELGKELAVIEGLFQTWRRGEIDAFDLEQKIHEFHQGVARDLFNAFQARTADHCVARAIVDGTLAQGEVSDAALRELEPAIRFHREDAARAAAST